MGALAKVKPAETGDSRADNTSLDTLTEEMISDLETAFRLFDTVRRRPHPALLCSRAPTAAAFCGERRMEAGRSPSLS